jgi:hypothetical protein
LFKIDEHGHVEGEFIWGEVWEQEEINSFDEPDSIRPKWYREGK